MRARDALDQTVAPAYIEANRRTPNRTIDTADRRDPLR